MWKVHILKACLNAEKDIWDALYFLVSLVPDSEISYQESGEILTILSKKEDRGSLAHALKIVLEKGYGHGKEKQQVT